jgi:hypothetical protein
LKKKVVSSWRSGVFGSIFVATTGCGLRQEGIPQGAEEGVEKVFSETKGVTSAAKSRMANKTLAARLKPCH